MILVILITGDVWYNSTLGKLRGAKSFWLGNRWKFKYCKAFNFGGAGTQTAALILWWKSQQDSVIQNMNTEEYDGSSWTEVADFNTAEERWRNGCRIHKQQVLLLIFFWRKWTHTRIKIWMNLKKNIMVQAGQNFFYYIVKFFYIILIKKKNKNFF